MRPDHVGLGGFDSHALPPPPPCRRAAGCSARLLLAGLGLSLLAVRSEPLDAQARDTLARRDTLRSRAPDSLSRGAARSPRDSLATPISPRRAFVYSVLLPGTAQAILNRPVAGALFVSVEVLALALASKAAYDLRFARAHQNDTVVVAYAVDPATGQPVLDPRTGLPTPVGTEQNGHGAALVKARRVHFEDWIAALAANHLFAGADAFVAALLWDLPSRLSIRALPRGATVGVSLAW